MEIAYKLKAKNSSGEQELFINYDIESKEVFFCMTGVYEGKDFQLDFDSIDKKDFEEFVNYVNGIDNRLNKRL